MSMDLYNYTYDLVRQIPYGMVSTYGAVARALGDIRASRAVGRMMNQNPDADTMPCFKIVQSDGTLGGFGLGINDKIRRLNEEDILVKENHIIDFESVCFTDFKTDYPLKNLREKQCEIGSKVICKDTISIKDVSLIAGFDVAYNFTDDWKESCGGCVLWDYQNKELVDSITLFHRSMFPYIPTYLAFREFPFIELLYNKLPQTPSVLMIDGNGILHPYQSGIACMVGVEFQIPTIGVAKSLLCGTLQSDQTVRLNNEVIGAAFSASPRVKKPVYISPGHNISLNSAVTIVQNCSTYKSPEPLRLAHNLATETLRKHQENHYLKQPKPQVQHTTV